MKNIFWLFLLAMVFLTACATNGNDKKRSSAPDETTEISSSDVDQNEETSGVNHPKKHYQPVDRTNQNSGIATPASQTQNLAAPQVTKMEEPKQKTRQPMQAPTATPVVATNTPKVVKVTEPSKSGPTPNLTKVNPTKAVETKPDPVPAQFEVNTPPPAPKPVVPLVNIDHSSFDQLLSKYVKANGQVNYMDLKGAQGKLESYLLLLAAKVPQSSWSKNERLAYWINAYNAFTLKLILNNYPVKSIRDIDNGNPWDTKWIKLGGRTYSLNQIEHEIIRPRFKDARIHFAVNCAAASCPPLANKAYTEQNVNQLLETQTRKFINNSQYNDLTGGTIKVSKLFDWYKEDFGVVIEYINRYAKSKVSASAKVDFKEYDWKLNGR